MQGATTEQAPAHRCLSREAIQNPSAATYAGVCEQTGVTAVKETPVDLLSPLEVVLNILGRVSEAL